MDCDICHNLLSDHTTCDDIYMGLIISEKLYNKYHTYELSELEAKIDYSFKKKAILKRALLSQSFITDLDAKIYKELRENYSLSYYPLNTLGDGVIDAIIMKQGFYLGKKTREQLNDYKKDNVKKSALGELSFKIDLQKYVLWGKGEIEQNLPTNENSKIHTELFEGLIGSIYLDGDFSSAKNSFLTIFNLSNT